MADIGFLTGNSDGLRLSAPSKVPDDEGWGPTEITALLDLGYLLRMK